MSVAITAVIQCCELVVLKTENVEGDIIIYVTSKMTYPAMDLHQNTM